MLNSVSNSSRSSSTYFASSPLFALLPLMLLMVATRYYHIGSAWHLPDASWAIFFLGGFYLQRKFFLLLLAEAVAIDFIFFALGGSNYCLSAAYGFLVPAYAALWFGGELLRKSRTRDVMFFVRGAAYWWVSASLAYLFTNASFYWLSDKAVDPSWANYFAHAKIWYSAFVSRPLLYLPLAALVHFAMVQSQRLRVALR
jgi:hypothetical protein